MQYAKIIIDDLAMIGHDLSDGEIVVHTLNGLANDYKELKAALRVESRPFPSKNWLKSFITMKLVSRTQTQQKVTHPLPISFLRSNIIRKVKMETQIPLKNSSITHEVTMATMGTTVINSIRILMEIMEIKIIPVTRTLQDSRTTIQIRIGGLHIMETNLELFVNYATNLVILPKYTYHVIHLLPGHKPTTQLMRLRVISRVG